MKNIFLKGLLIIGIAITVLAALYYKESNKDLPLSEIFPEEHPYQAEIEFVDQAVEKQIQSVPKKINQVKTQKIVQQIKIAEPVKKLTQTELVNSNAIDKKNTATATINVQKAYSIQVASLSDKSKAEGLIQSLKKKSFDSFFKTANVENKGVVYRIYAGNFETKEKAEDFLKSYKKDLSGGFVVAIK